MDGDPSTTNEKETIVGFEDEAYNLKHRLADKRSRLTLISVVGMPGLGKTTLTRKVYNDSFIANHFYIRAWISVSQVYKKTELLRGLLRSPYIQTSGDIERMREARLCEELYKGLKGKKYLIVMDDVWSIEAWDDLKSYLPDDNNGSRIVFTSRIADIALHAKRDSFVHKLRFFSKEESWDLLQEKVFRNGEVCPRQLEEVGKEIAEKCRGLPLRVVVVGGILAKTERKIEWWHEIAQSIRSHVASDIKLGMETLELSYTHLPSHLKPCFLYFGVFPEDYDIPVSKLTWLWIAEGFVDKSGEETLEDLALSYLIDLIERSLVMIGKSSTGGIKSCCIHDLLRDLCLIKAQEENFFLQYDNYQTLESSTSSVSSSSYSSSSSSSSSYSPSSSYNGLIVRFDSNSKIPSSDSLEVACSLLYFRTGYRTIGEKLVDSQRSILEDQVSRIFSISRLLRVLDLMRCPYYEFPANTEYMMNLKYLALRVDINEIPQSVSNLKNLETLLIKGLRGEIGVPPEVCGLISLRHLRVDARASLKWSSSSFMLADLQTISTATFYDTYEFSVFKFTPNLRKLRCILFCGFPELNFLVKLEKLKMFHHGQYRVINVPELPINLKKITLSRLFMPWEEIAKLGKLPNLEVLKLLNDACSGEQWDTVDEGFPKLKLLKLDYLAILRWNISSEDHFPSLQKLVLNRLWGLESVPNEVVDIPTLETIELNMCGPSTTASAREIEKEQLRNGNERPEISIYPPES